MKKGSLKGKLLIVFFLLFGIGGMTAGFYYLSQDVNLSRQFGEKICTPGSASCKYYTYISPLIMLLGGMFSIFLAHLVNKKGLTT